MFEEREFEGKDLEQALHAAAEVLGIPEPELDYEIVEQGRRGLFGVGAKSVRIRVMPPLASVPDPLAEVAEAPMDGGDLSEAPAAERFAPTEPERVRATPTRTERPAPAPRAVEPRSPDGAQAPGGNPVDVTQVLQRILDLMGLEIEARSAASDNGITIELDGADREALTKQDGDLLQALQFLLNRMSRRAWPDAGPIHLSCNGGLPDRRDDELVDLTREVAEQVQRTGRTQRMQPMNAYERRLVHLTVREYEQLGSRSEGNGHLKRVKIFKHEYE